MARKKIKLKYNLKILLLRKFIFEATEETRSMFSMKKRAVERTEFFNFPDLLEVREGPSSKS